MFTGCAGEADFRRCLPGEEVYADDLYWVFLLAAATGARIEELGQLHEPVLTKDAIAGRIRRLLAMADKRAEDLGIPDTESSLTPEMMAEDV